MKRICIYVAVLFVSVLTSNPFIDHGRGAASDAMALPLFVSLYIRTTRYL